MALVRRDDILQLMIEDDGRGIDTTVARAADARRGLGLIGMRERAGSLGGRVYVRPGVERGTIVTLELPFKGPGLPAAGP